MTGTFARLNAIKDANPSLKVLISVGGQRTEENKEGDVEEAFDALVRSDEALVAFGLSLVEFVRENGLNGAEIDWPKPEKNGLTRILRVSEYTLCNRIIIRVNLSSAIIKIMSFMRRWCISFLCLQCDCMVHVYHRSHLCIWYKYIHKYFIYIVCLNAYIQCDLGP